MKTRDGEFVKKKIGFTVAFCRHVEKLYTITSHYTTFSISVIYFCVTLAPTALEGCCIALTYSWQSAVRLVCASGLCV